MSACVLAFAGHRLVLDGAEEAELRSFLDLVLDEVEPVSGHGSLAGGSDVLWAEALAARAVPVHIVLPFALDEFLTTSVDPCGPTWAARARSVLEGAASSTVVTDAGTAGDDRRYALATECYQERARVEAGRRGVTAVFAVVWDEVPVEGIAGTGADVARWVVDGDDPIIVPPVGRRVGGG